MVRWISIYRTVKLIHLKATLFYYFSDGKVLLSLTAGRGACGLWCSWLPVHSSDTFLHLLMIFLMVSLLLPILLLLTLLIFSTNFFMETWRIFSSIYSTSEFPTITLLGCCLIGSALDGSNSYDDTIKLKFTL